jgi:hypothetical protein
MDADMNIQKLIKESILSNKNSHGLKWEVIERSLIKRDNSKLWQFPMYR